MSKETITITGIVKHRGKPCFKIIFPSLQSARRYKNMNNIILKDDGYSTSLQRGYYDNEVSMG